MNNTEKSIQPDESGRHPRRPPLVLVPPPLVFVLTFLVALGLQQLAPIEVRNETILMAGRIGGWILVGCALLIEFSCFGFFLVARTTVIPFGNASKLVTRGPYRITRNPMYLSLTLAYLGAACLFADPWALPLLALPVGIMHFVVIPFEEEKLRRIFGGEFDRYCATVRRWF